MKNTQALLKRIQEELASLDLILDDQIELSSLDLVAAAVHLEKVFHIRFTLDEISPDSFKTLDKIAEIVQKKQDGIV